MKVCHLLHIVRYLHHLNYDQVRKVYISYLVKTGLRETNHLVLFLITVVCLHNLVICDDKKPNLFLKELILSWAIVARFLFPPLNSQENQQQRDVLLLLLNEADSDLKGCSGSTSRLFGISEHPLVFQNFSIAFRKLLLYSKVLNLIDPSVNLCLQGV